MGTIKRIGMLTSGGDCQALNAAMRGVVKSLWYTLGGDQVEIYGFNNGYRGLIYHDYRKFEFKDFSGISCIFIEENHKITLSENFPYKCDLLTDGWELIKN